MLRYIIVEPFSVHYLSFLLTPFANSDLPIQNTQTFPYYYTKACRFALSRATMRPRPVFLSLLWLIASFGGVNANKSGSQHDERSSDISAECTWVRITTQDYLRNGRLTHYTCIK